MGPHPHDGVADPACLCHPLHLVGQVVEAGCAGAALHLDVDGERRLALGTALVTRLDPQLYTHTTTASVAFL